MKHGKFTRFLCLLVSVLLIIPFAGCKEGEAAEENSITVFSWEDYIDEDLLDEFEEESGIKVNYYTFATNEEMYNELVKDPSACDLICPSDYMIMKMIDEDLIKRYEMPESFKDYGSEYIKKVFKGLNFIEDGTDLTYAVGYMWGTMGYIYNAQTVDPEDLINWDGIINDAYKGKSTIKDSVRDTYFMALAMVYKEELLEYKQQYIDGEITKAVYNQKLNEVFNRTDDQSISKVKDALMDVKPYLYSFEVDSGKSDILTGKIDINFAWSGDAVYALELGDEAGVELNYAVPEEGSNVWFDGWVMSKASEKTDQSALFLDFICRPENAVRNMDIVGYTPCIGGDEVFENALDWYGTQTLIDAGITKAEYDELPDEEKENYVVDADEKVWEYAYLTGADVAFDPIEEVYIAQVRSFNEDDEVVEVEEIEVYRVDLKYFFDPTLDEGDETYVIYSEETGRGLYAQYADEQTINRCVVMENFDKDTLKKINDMWNDVKLVTLPTYAMIIIAAVIVGAIVAVVVLKFKKPEFMKVKDKAEKK